MNATVNGVWALAASTGYFAVRVPLVPGNNTIEARAEDAAGNVALARDYVTFIPPDLWYVHPGKHFRLPVPYGWGGVANLTKDGVPVDLYLYATDLDANLIVVSESRRLTGEPSEAYRILGEATDNLTRAPGFRFLAPTFDRAISGHVAATAFVTWQPPLEVVDQVITVVLGPEYGMFWILVGTFYPANVSAAGPVINATVEAFEVLPPPAFDIAPWGPHILAAGLLATAVEGCAFAVAILRARRRRMPWDRAYL